MQTQKVIDHIVNWLTDYAKKANVKRLIIGHYSKRYSNLNELLKESKEIFENTFLAKEGDILDFDTL